MKPKIQKSLFIFFLSFAGICCATLRSINLTEYPLLTDRREIKGYVEQVGKKILASPELKYRDSFAYKFEIVHNCLKIVWTL